jgi:hypothetical protein
MATIDLGAGQREMAMRMFQAAYGGNDSGEDELTKELDRQAQQATRDAAERRLQVESGARISDLKARQGIAQQRAGAYISAEQQREEMERQQILRGQEASGRAAEFLPYKERLSTAQTGAANASAEASRAAALERKVTAVKRQLETQGVADKNAREVAEGLVNDSERITNHYIGMAAGGQPIDKNGTDEFVKAMQHLGNNKFYDVPRNPDGSWKYDPKQVAQQFPMTDDKGIPTFRAAKEQRDINMPGSDFGKKLRDVRAILDDPSQSEDMKRAATNELVSISSPTMPKIQGAMVQRLIDVGAYPQAINLMKDFQNKDGGNGKLKMPSASAQSDITNRISVIGTQNELMDRWKELQKQGLIPVGTWRKPVLDMLKDIGANNADVQVFRDLLNVQVSQYMNLMHGRRYMEKEMEFITNSMPSQYDSPATFEEVLRSMRAHMIQDVRERAGSLQDWGYQIPKGIDPIPVIQSLHEGHMPAGIEFDDGGYLPPEAIRDQALGIDILRQQAKRRGQDIGGTGAFRDNNTDQLGMSYSPTEPPVDEEKAMRDEISKMTPEQVRKELAAVPDLRTSPEDTAADLGAARKEALEQAQTP